MSFLVKIVDVAFQVYAILILVRVVLSWVRHNPYHPVIRFVYDMTDPYLNIFRRLLPPIGVVDFSPVIAFFFLELLRALTLWVLGLLVGLV